MSHRILTTGLTTLLLLATASAAQASYLMTEKQADSFARSDVTARYVDLNLGDDSNVNLNCRPSRRTKFNASDGRRYHRWVCDWKTHTLDDTSCAGRMVIVGSGEDRDNTYRQATLAGARCTPKNLVQWGGIV